MCGKETREYQAQVDVDVIVLSNGVGFHRWQSIKSVERPLERKLGLSNEIYFCRTFFIPNFNIVVI